MQVVGAAGRRSDVRARSGRVRRRLQRTRGRRRRGPRRTWRAHRMIVFFTGPSGSGKTTLAHAWAASRSAPTAVIDADQITSWVRLGPEHAITAAFREGPVER